MVVGSVTVSIAGLPAGGSLSDPLDDPFGVVLCTQT